MTEINSSKDWNPNEDKLSEIKKQLELFQQTASNINSPLQNNDTIENRCARLILLLIKIEEELNKVEKTLEKIWHLGYTNNNEITKRQSQASLETVKKLQFKIRAARLNLNYMFI